MKVKRIRLFINVSRINYASYSLYYFLENVKNGVATVTSSAVTSSAVTSSAVTSSAYYLLLLLHLQLR